MSELVITIVRVAVDDLKEKTERERPIWERIKTAIAWLVPPARTTQPHCVAGIGRASEAQDLPTARDQGRIPDAHHSAVPRHGDTRLWEAPRPRLAGKPEPFDGERPVFRPLELRQFRVYVRNGWVTMLTPEFARRRKPAARSVRPQSGIFCAGPTQGVIGINKSD